MTAVGRSRSGTAERTGPAAQAGIHTAGQAASRPCRAPRPYRALPRGEGTSRATSRSGTRRDVGVHRGHRGTCRRGGGERPGDSMTSGLEADAASAVPPAPRPRGRRRADRVNGYRGRPRGRTFPASRSVSWRHRESGVMVATLATDAGATTTSVHYRMARKSKYTKDILEPVVASCSSVGQVLDHLGLRRAGGNYRSIGQKIRALELDTSHFLGAAHNKGKTKGTDAGMRRSANFNRLLDSEVFKLGSTYSTRHLSRRLREAGEPYSCGVCGNVGVWHGEPITLHVDHIDGDLSNALRSNLRFLCPNCHQQTKTWGSKKKMAL